MLQLGLEPPRYDQDTVQAKRAKVVGKVLRSLKVAQMKTRFVSEESLPSRR